VNTDSWTAISSGEAAVEAPADLGVLTLDVLPDDHEVDVRRRFIERSADTVDHLDRAEVDVLAKLAVDRDQQSPE
jgi:hypothetical protein